MISIIITITGALMLIAGIFSISNLHYDLEQNTYHWSFALDIGTRAGVLLGLGFGLIIASIIGLIF